MTTIRWLNNSKLLLAEGISVESQGCPLTLSSSMKLLLETYSELLERFIVESVICTGHVWRGCSHHGTKQLDILRITHHRHIQLQVFHHSRWEPHASHRISRSRVDHSRRHDTDAVRTREMPHRCRLVAIPAISFNPRHILPVQLRRLISIQ